MSRPIVVLKKSRDKLSDEMDVMSEKINDLNNAYNMQALELATFDKALNILDKAFGIPMGENDEC